MRTSYLIMLACNAGLAAMATPALAQQASPADASLATAAPPPVPAKPTNLAGVVVTATKRAESIQSVPVTVTVVTGAQLKNQNIYDIQDLTDAVPALSGQLGSPVTLQIRGIGVPSNSRTAESSVGIVVDGVALDNATIGAPQLFDVSRTEVLEGPQDTLFGRSTSAGVLNITTNAPDPTKTEVIVHGDQGTRDSYNHEAVFNLPVSTYSALRIAVADTRDPETVYNDYLRNWDDVHNTSFRLRYLWAPTDNLTVNLIADHTSLSATGGGQWPVYQSTPNSRLTGYLAQCGIVPSQNNTQTCNDANTYQHGKSEGFSGQVDYQLGNVTLSSISSVRHLLSDQGGDADSTPVNLLNINSASYDLHNESQEFRVTSSDNAFFDYVGGLYYFHSTQTDQTLQQGMPLYPIPLVLGQSSLTNATESSYALFGEGTFKFTPSFRGILGLRFGEDRVAGETTRALAPDAILPFTGIADINGNTNHKYSSFRVGVQDDLSSNAMGYITFTKGYKGPAINDQATTNNVPVVIKPEVPLAWEAGVKTTWLDDRLGINASIFDTRYENFQTLFFNAPSATFVYGNAPTVTIKGVELSAFGHITQDLTMNLGVLYNDGKYGDGYIVACAPNQTAAAGCVTMIKNGVKTQTTDAGGNTLVFAPKLKTTLNGTYRHGLNDALDGFISADAVFTTKVYFDQAYDPDDTTGAHTIYGTKFGVRAHDDQWGVYLYVRNIFNEHVPQSRFSTPAGTILGDYNAYSQIFGADAFRVVGVSFDVRF